MTWNVAYIDQDLRNEMKSLLGENELRRFESRLRMSFEKLGDPIAGLGSIRKLRYPIKVKNKGTRSGIRVLLAYLTLKNEVMVFDMYEKSKKSDLSKKEIKLIAEAIKTFQKESKGEF